MASGLRSRRSLGTTRRVNPDDPKQPRASAFWPLITGGKDIVIQAARKREIDDRVFKYVGVAGVDQPRIVQVGVGAENLPDCK
jgi:hypothetical protein